MLSYKFEKFETKLTEELDLWGTKYNYKKSYILKLSDEKTERTYQGELNNFESLHKIDIEISKIELEYVLNKICKSTPSFKNIDFAMPCFNLFPALNYELKSLPTSALFCIETALLMYLKENSTLVINLKHFSTSGLYIPNINDDIPALIQKWNRNEFSTIKMKIGRDLKLEKQMLKEITSNQGFKNIKLRLDGNLKMSPSALGELLKGIPVDCIDYLEDPLKDISKWNTFYEEKQVPLALDENFQTISVYPNGTKAIVIKPSITHSISGTYKLIRDSGLEIVISSSFETTLGMNGLKFLAAESKQDAGLDTLKYLENDL